MFSGMGGLPEPKAASAAADAQYTAEVRGAVLWAEDRTKEILSSMRPTPALDLIQLPLPCQGGSAGFMASVPVKLSRTGALDMGRHSGRLGPSLARLTAFTPICVSHGFELPWRARSSRVFAGPLSAATACNAKASEMRRR